MNLKCFSIKDADFAGFRGWLLNHGIELAAFSAVFLVAALADRPENIPIAGHFFCPFRRFTGLPCPGCGLTHAFIALFHGNFAAAFEYNALVYLLAPFFAFRILRSLSAGLFRKYFEIKVSWLYAIILFLLAAFSYSAYRVIRETGLL